MDGAAGGGAAVVLIAVVGFFGRMVIYADRHDRAKARRPQRPRMIERSPLLGEPRWLKPAPEPEDKRPPLVEVPDRLLVRAARVVARQEHADAQLLEREMPVIPAMAEKLIHALEGRGIVGSRDLAGRAQVLVKPGDLPTVFDRWGITEDA